MAIYPNIYQTLVPCPIVELRGYLAACGLKGRLYAYLDYNGPTGTSRDSVAEGMLALAAEKHKLLPGQPIIEAASGSFAMALALAGRTAGHPVVLTMPEDAPVTIAIFISGSPFSCDYFRLCTLRMDFFFCGLDEDSPLPFPVDAGFVFLCPAFEFL